jgi:alpha-glucosidase
MKDFQKLLLSCLISFSAFTIAAQQKAYLLHSPDQRLKLEITQADKLSFTVSDDKGLVVTASEISLQLADGSTLATGDKIKKVTRSEVNQSVSSPFYKKASVQENYRQLRLAYKDYALVFRAYNDGVAYRFETSKKKDFIVESEIADFQFENDAPLFAAYVSPGSKGKSIRFEKQFFNSFENVYTHAPLSTFSPDSLLLLPLMADAGQGRKLLFTEVNLESYPGMYLHTTMGKPGLSGVFAPYPKEVRQGGHNMLQMLIDTREAYIAKVSGTRSFPWRVLGVFDNDAEILNSDLVYQLADESRVKDVSWIKPGKVAWDWWNAWNISGVDFVSGVNTETYQYYIDFAASQGIEYVILDEGWAVNLQADLMQVVPEIDMKAIIKHAEDKGVGIILWAGYYAFARDMENICRHYRGLGVKGFKIDFMDRDDQLMTEFIYKAADVCARYHMLVDFHGMYKPTGLQRTYPNVLNNEGVFGLEQLKWSNQDMVLYDVTFPFIRMFAGPVDYTQGAMRNAIKSNFKPIYTEPMSQGTRCRQLAQYVVYDSPLNMLCDNPTNYLKEPLCTGFIAQIPTVWDETVTLSGEVSKYITIARRKGDVWYAGGLTDWQARDLEIDFYFLPAGTYELELFRDGINADKVAMDFKHEKRNIQSGEKLKVHLAPGGGFAVRMVRL